MAIPDALSALEPLRQAADGLLMQSETDAPFELFFWPDAEITNLTPEHVLELAGAAKDTQIETVSLQTFFRNATTSEDWHNAEEAAQVEQFKAMIKATRKHLRDERVYRIGATKLDCYIVGGIEGGCGGLKTQIVET